MNQVTGFNILVVTHLLAALIMIIYPIGVAVCLVRRFHLGWGLFWIGGVTFILSQVFHIPFNSLATQLFARGILPRPPLAYAMVFNAIFLGLSAGFFEEFARYFMYRWWVKDARSWSKGVLLGAGHGGMEAIIFGAIALINYLYLVSTPLEDIVKIVPPDQLSITQQAISHYWSMPWYDSLIGAIERILTVPIHISLSVLVLQVFTRRKALWLWLAISYHAVIDAAAVLAIQNLGIYASEAIVAGFTLLSIGIVFVLRQPEPPEPVVEDLPPIQPVKLIPVELEENSENLDKSKYNS